MNTLVFKKYTFVVKGFPTLNAPAMPFSNVKGFSALRASGSIPFVVHGLLGNSGGCYHYSPM
jgi:hypothetical protein